MIEKGKVLFYIQVAPPNEISYVNPISSDLAKHPSEVITFEFDNHSDAAMLTYARQLLTNTTDCFVYLEVKDSSEQTGQVRPFLELLMQRPLPENQLIWTGSQPIVDKIAPHAGGRKVQGKAEARYCILNWLGISAA